MNDIKSILNDILEDIKKETDVKKVRVIVLKRITRSKINNKDKQRMINVINNKKDYNSLVKAIYDLVLKYEGEGVINKSLNGGKLK